MTVKEKIQFLVARGVKIVELANRVNCNQTTLGRWLRGETNISSRLEKDLNVAIIQFIEELEILKEWYYGINLYEDKS